MNYLDKLERKLGKYAVPNLITYLLAGYVVGFILQILAPNWLQYLTLEPYFILKGQIWRILTWVLVPPDTSILFLLIMMLFYYQLGTTLERTWGTFRFNAYIFGGVFFTILGAFGLYAATFFFKGQILLGMGSFFTTNYINLSIFLAFALCYPDMQVLLYFIIPIRMKWLAIVYVVMILFEMLQVGWAGRIAIFMSLLNFVLFYMSTRNFRRMSPKEIHRRQSFQREVHRGMGNGITKHKCAICGRTEQDGIDLEFRFCSKCDGNYEYCQDHLFTHTHVKRGV